MPNPPRRSVLHFLLIAAAVYAAVCLLAWWFQERLIYFPSAHLPLRPSDLGLAYEEVWLDTSDGERLHAWWIPAREGEPRGAILIAHGNGGNLAYSLEHAGFFAASGLSTLVFDYRGYGQSSGRPGEEGTYLDAEAAWEHLRTVRGVAPGRLFAFGQSLGAAVAIELGLRRPLAGLIVENAFTSLPDVGAGAYPWLPVRWLSKHRYASVDKVGRLEVPFLSIHAERDEIVPFEHQARLFAAASEPKERLITPGGHNDGGFLRSEAGRQAVRAFLGGCLEASSAD